MNTAPATLAQKLIARAAGHSQVTAPSETSPANSNEPARNAEMITGTSAP